MTLNSELMQLGYDIVALRAEMKKNLQEVYNYNSYDIEAAQDSNLTAAPWSAQQHRAFLSKLGFYMKDQLQRNDAALTSMNGEYNAFIVSATEEAKSMNENF